MSIPDPLDRSSQPSDAGAPTRLWHPFAAMGKVDGHEFVLTRGDGCRVWDADGDVRFDSANGGLPPTENGILGPTNSVLGPNQTAQFNSDDIIPFLQDQTQRPIQRNPALDFRIHKMLLSPAHLPDAIVGSHPIVGHPIQHLPNLGPHIVGNRCPIFVIQINRIHELAVNVELQLS